MTNSKLLKSQISVQISAKNPNVGLGWLKSTVERATITNTS